MTDTQWDACADPTPMLDFLRGKASDRKLRLFACACAEGHASIVERVEKFVDQRATVEELRRLVDPWDYRGHEENGWYRLALPDQFTADAAAEIARDSAAAAGYRATTYNAFSAARDGRRKIQSRFLRCIFGNPFQAAEVAPSWRAWNNAATPKMAQTIYDDRAFDRLPLLADALEEAGCTDAAILSHCRERGEHVRGCWVVDLLLGKS